MEIKENVLIVTEKNSKYTEHKDDITRFGRQIIAFVFLTSSIIPNHLLHSLKLLGLKESLYITLHEAVILDTCRIIRKFKQIKEEEVCSYLHSLNIDTHHIAFY